MSKYSYKSLGRNSERSSVKEDKRKGNRVKGFLLGRQREEHIHRKKARSQQRFKRGKAVPFCFHTVLRGRLQIGRCCHHFFIKLPPCPMAGEAVMNRCGIE